MKDFIAHLLFLATAIVAKPLMTVKAGEVVNKEEEDDGSKQIIQHNRRKLQEHDVTQHVGELKVFVTSTLHTANLDGAGEGDRICNNLASSAGINGYFRAWLSDSSGASPNTRFDKSGREAYFLMDGTEIARNWADLTDGTIKAPINQDENGNLVPRGSYVFTGTNKFGNPTSSTCNDWEVTSSALVTAGDPTVVTRGWTGGAIRCSQQARLYCFEQDMPQLKVFATSTFHTGNLGGIEGGDRICRGLASSTGLKGVYKAWLSDSSGASPNMRFYKSAGKPYFLTDGRTEIAGSWADLTDGSIKAPINRDENGNLVPGGYVFTGTNKFGNPTSSTCSDWKDASSALVTAGTATVVDLGWTGGAIRCSQQARLYCFEQDLPPHNKVFVTSTLHGARLQTRFRGGTSNGNVICNSLASSAGLTHSFQYFRAWLSDSSGASPNTRFDKSVGKPYLLPDGTEIASSWADLTDGTIKAPINRDENGNLVPGGSYVFTGTNQFGNPTSSTCNDWKDASSALVTAGDPTVVTRGWTGGAIRCSQQARLYCFEQEDVAGMQAADDISTEDVSDKLSKGSIIGGSVAIAFFFAVTLAVVVCMCRRKNRGSQQQQHEEAEEDTDENEAEDTKVGEKDTSAVDVEVDVDAAQNTSDEDDSDGMENV